MKRPATLFFCVVFLISWGGGAIFRGHPLALFPALIASVAGTGIALTSMLDGRRGLERLWQWQRTWRLGPYYALALVPPSLILVVLFVLRAAYGSVFTPNRFLLGFLFGVPAGLLEEIGWTGFAFPRLAESLGRGRASVVLGVLWGLWHLPVIDALGAASPHGPWLPAFFAAFVVALAGLRVIIAWAATNTRSVLIAQLIHVSSTGCLVMLGPSGVTPAQEALWYAGYAIALWALAAVLLVSMSREARR